MTAETETKNEVGMLAAAPDVQGEPVGYVSPRLLDALRSGKACGITMEDKPDAHNGVTIPLYTAPQPAEQQPISHDWDDQDKCRRCGDKDWYASATCTPKQQPAPDVAALVEALEDIGASWHGVNTELERYMRNVARLALAALAQEQS